MGNYNDFDLDIKKVQENNDVNPASLTTNMDCWVTSILVTTVMGSCKLCITEGDCTNTCDCTDFNTCGMTCRCK